MKTRTLLMVLTMIGLCGSTFGQSMKPSTASSLYLVQVPHTQEQCLKTLSDFKDKGDAFLAKFEFGCMSGDHTGYAFLEGTSVENVRLLLPTDEQKVAKITKVDKFTAAQIEKLHKEHM